MMVKNVTRLASKFSLRSRINLSDVSQIHTTSREMTRQWNNLIFNKLVNTQANDITVHICPWEDEDWQQYLELGDRISRMVIWLSGDMQLGVTTNDKIEIVQYQSSELSERFSVVVGTGIARALVSWSQPSKEGALLGVLISSPLLSHEIVHILEQQIANVRT